MRAPRPIFVLCLVAVTVGAAAPAPLQAAPAPKRVRVEAPAGQSILVHGEYPPVQSSCADPEQPVLHARYRGAVEVARAPDGSLFVVGELPFEEYLKGIAEVPRSWPLEALKAQVVAARSYAAAQLSRTSSEGRTLGYDLCATDACQVYLGTGVESGAWGSRWVRGVEETAGQVLLHEGEPAETFYFSTSNGRTFTNQEIWGSDPLPYLPSVREEDDSESPLSRWKVKVPLGDLAKFLRRSGHWSGEPLRGVRVDGEALVLRGRAKARERFPLEEIRGALNAAAPCLAPDRYPPTGSGGSRLPQTVPSKWFDARVQGRALVLEGRGWGHGIGLVQWGAKGKADRGLGYDDILAAYYGGLRPQRHRSPGTIRVLIAKGLRSVTLAPSGEASLEGADRAPDPPWRITRAGAKRVRVRSGTAPVPLLQLSRVRPITETGTPARVTFEASGDLRARLEFLADEKVLATTPWRALESGRSSLQAPAPDGASLLRVRGTDGVDTVVTDAMRTASAEAPTSPPPEPSPVPSLERSTEPTPRAGPTSEDRGGPAFTILTGAAALAFMAATLLRWGHRKRLHHD